METKLETKPKQSGAKIPNYWVISLIVLGTALLGFSAYYAITRAGNASQTAPATLPVSEPKTPPAVSALGRLEPQGETIKVAPPSALGSSRISRLLVKEGDRVQKDQVIALLDSYERTLAAVKQAESQVAVRQSIVEQVKAGAKTGDIEAQRANMMSRKANLARWQNELEIAKSDLQRYEMLVKDGAASEFQRDSYMLKVKSLTGQIAQANEDIAQAENLLNSVAEVRPTDVRVAEAQLASAIADLEKAKADLVLTAVRAPIAGQVLKIHAKSGEAVNTNNGVLELGNTSQMYVVAEVYETDIGKVKVGQRATITSEVIDGEITGKVEHIGLRIAKNDVLGTDPAAKTDVRVIEVRIKLDDSAKVSNLTNHQVKVKIEVLKS
ncbi:ABC exporter membrane fusion protein [Pseudanabaena sp. PCC 6802]|uniref:ABC exporter membrane fusion protein n=1 Tax=Pseudanabaena sp. PCC 6802 TaxID=118173 RepID=UPI000349B450|nr:ABC exporter membrane fusion protein [Pseudanabaena sp. PCC 6802]